MRTKLEAIGNKARVYAEHVGRVSYEDEIEEFLRVDIPLLLTVARAVADIVRVMTPIQHPKSPTDYAYGKATNEQWRALVAAIAPLLEEEK